MTEEKLNNLLENLRSATREGSLQWEPIKDDSQGLALQLNSARVDITVEIDVAGGRTFLVTIRNPFGDPMEIFPFAVGDTHRDLVRELYNLARDKASGVDEVIDSIIAEVASSK